MASEATAATGSTAHSNTELTFSETVPAVCGINYQDSFDKTGSIKFRGEIGTEEFATFKLSSNTSQKAKIWFTDISIIGKSSTNTSITEKGLVKIAVSTDLTNLSSTARFEQEFTKIDNQTETKAVVFNTTDAVKALALVNKQAVDFKAKTPVIVKATVNVKCE